MSRFIALFQDWELAQAAAVRAEACVCRHLDAYCEGTGRAPSLEEIALAPRERAAARDAFRALARYLAIERQSLPVL